MVRHRASGRLTLDLTETILDFATPMAGAAMEDGCRVRLLIMQRIEEELLGGARPRSWISFLSTYFTP